MFSGNLRNFHRTLAFRLTLWYAGIFSLSFLLVFSAFYAITLSEVQRRVDSELMSELKEYTLILKNSGIKELGREVHTDSKAEGEDLVFYRIYDVRGKLLHSSDTASWGQIPFDKKRFRTLTKKRPHRIETVEIAGRGHRDRILYGRIGPSTFVHMGLSLARNQQLASLFLRIFALTMGGIVILAAMVGWFMARRALFGLTEVTETADAIANGELASRVPAKARGHEIERLATTFNRMADRNQALIRQIREMTDNIAHDLRSPVTRIRGIAEVTLTTGGGIGAYENMAVSAIEECDDILTIINTMLYISETEAGLSELEKERINLDGLVRTACELFMPLAEERGIALKCSAAPPCAVYGDISLLQRMVANLLDNALKYTPKGGTVTVTAGPGPAGITLTVGDTGCGIEKTHLPHIFKRFYRCDKSRSRGGAGLGLALVWAIVREHGGGVSVKSAPGAGSTFTVTFPPGKPKTQAVHGIIRKS